ncbi:MAG: N-acetylmuramoyl-L-alanine amidase [Proteobacteria bacterium]|nr:N-acetylmuramoyl-L-alanine amidase [Pseudomonadota bacterium]
MMPTWIRHVRLFVLALVAAAVFAGTAEGAKTDTLFTTAETTREHLDQDKSAQGYRHNWLKAIENYQNVIEAEPSGTRAPQAALAVADLYLALFRRSRIASDLDQALRQYRTVTKRYTQSPQAPLAQLRIGQVYHVYKNDPDRAYVEFLKVELNHPKSPEVAQARKKLAEISGATASTPKAPDPPAAVEAGKETPPAPPLVKPAVAGPAEPARAPLAQIQGVRTWSNPSYTRVAIDVDRQISFKDHLLRQDPGLKKPMRLYLDMQTARLASDVKEEVTIGDGLLERARIGQFDHDTVRVVLDIRHISNYRIFYLSNPFRIVVDVTGEREKVAAARPEPAKPAEPARPEAVKPAKPATPEPAEPKAPLIDLRETAGKRKKIPRGPARISGKKSSLARQLGLGINRIVLDPGHGGKDCGAIGISGLKEKDLTLDFSRRLAGRIEKKLGLHVVLTRDKDVFIPLEERTAIANTNGADLFVSVHANAHRDPKQHGIETYFLSLATDDEAMRVAALENAASTKNMSDLQMILNDLMLNSKINESARLATQVHRQMVGQVRKKYRNIRDLKVKQAPFYVLIGANMPSVLLELGFVSNSAEEKRLRNQRYMDQLADGIIEGIRLYTQSFKRPQ